jgi:putative ABC transport system permease protein
MIKTRLRKILRDVGSRKTRTFLVSFSIFIGVFGVVALFSTGELLIKQLEKDIQKDHLAMMRIVLTASREAQIDNDAALATLRTQPGVTVLEGRAVYPILWKLPDEDRFRDGIVAAYSEPLDQLVLEVPRLTRGAFPEAGQGQIAIERRMAERWDLEIGDQIDVRVLSAAGSSEIVQETLTISGITFQAYGEQTNSGLADYESLAFAAYPDAQRIAGFNGYNLLYGRFIDYETAKVESAHFQAAISDNTEYTPVFSVVENPEKSPVIENTRRTNGVLIMLAMVALLVSGFLVVNVVNSIVVEQRRQIGVMKSLGASRFDNFYIFAGIALSYGLLGVIPGVILGVPGGYFMAQALAEQSNTIIEEFAISPAGIILGIVVGLAVPFLAAVIPVFNGTRVSILSAMTDYGISTDYGQGPIARVIRAMPLPLTLRQAFNNVNQKKFRLALTGITLTVAVGAFMGIFAVFSSLNAVVDDIFAVFGSEMSIVPLEGQQFEAIRDVVMTDEFKQRLDEKGLLAITSVDPGAQLAIEVEGYEPPPAQTGPPGVSAFGINADNPELMDFDLRSGTDWRENPDLDGIVISSNLADATGKDAGDSMVIQAGGGKGTFAIIGVINFPFDWIWMRYEDLAHLGGLYLVPPSEGDDSAGEIYPNSISIMLDEPDPTVEQVDAVIEEVKDAMLANGVNATYTNWIEFREFISNFIMVFNIILYFAAALIAAVGAIGLLTSLSMSVFERQKEIGVMRSVGATSRAVALQFLVEGLTIGILAWVAGIPLGYIISRGLNSALPFQNLGGGFPLQTIILGLVGMIIVVTIASLWPSLAAARRTISDILRYQ